MTGVQKITYPKDQRGNLINCHAYSVEGETMFVKEVFPEVPLLANFEFYYHSSGADLGFDPEFVPVFQDPSRLRKRAELVIVGGDGVS